MYHRFFIPVCLINIVAVFFHFSVNGHKTFIVSSCYAAFVSGCTSEIKHVPDMAGPDPWTFFQHFCHMLMVQRLIFLTVVLACRVRTVIRDDSFTSILRQSKADFRMNFMEVVHPRTIVFHFPAIPSEIMVVAFHICNPMHWSFDRCHGHMRDRRQTGWIHFFRKSIQFFVIFH